MEQRKRILISAGGTGGHIFPALAVANRLRAIDESIEIEFVGAEGRMEMTKIPAAGFPITGLPVIGFPRKISFKVFVFFGKLYHAMRRAKRKIKDFNPTVAVGFGGYASGPALRAAVKKHIPVIIQEQNSYAGVTNKLLAKSARKICVAYDNMDKYFPADKIVFTGNPIRKNILNLNMSKEDACHELCFDINRTIVFVTGGSLGACSINDAVFSNLKYFKENDIQILWQCGALYFEEYTKRLGYQRSETVFLTKFVEKMEYAYACSDIIVSRAGACTISELCIVGKPSILIPSPNVAEDHQTHNAQALADKNATILLPDKNAKKELTNKIKLIVNDEDFASTLSKNIKKMAKPDADILIANEILKVINDYE